jgi:hypothetical protein
MSDNLDSGIFVPGSPSGGSSVVLAYSEGSDIRVAKLRLWLAPDLTVQGSRTPSVDLASKVFVYNPITRYSGPISGLSSYFHSFAVDWSVEDGIVTPAQTSPIRPPFAPVSATYASSAAGREHDITVSCGLFTPPYGALLQPSAYVELRYTHRVD